MSKTVKTTTVYPDYFFSFFFSLSCFPLYRYAARPITEPYRTAKNRYISVYRYIDTALGLRGYLNLEGQGSRNHLYYITLNACTLIQLIHFFQCKKFVRPIVIKAYLTQNTAGHTVPIQYTRLYTGWLVRESGFNCASTVWISLCELDSNVARLWTNKARIFSVKQGLSRFEHALHRLTVPSTV